MGAKPHDGTLNASASVQYLEVIDYYCRTYMINYVRQSTAMQDDLHCVPWQSSSEELKAKSKSTVNKPFNENSWLSYFPRKSFGVTVMTLTG